jgi:hypothetical protein
MYSRICWHEVDAYGAVARAESADISGHMNGYEAGSSVSRIEHEPPHVKSYMLANSMLLQLWRLQAKAVSGGFKPLAEVRPGRRNRPQVLTVRARRVEEERGHGDGCWDVEVRVESAGTGK